MFTLILVGNRIAVLVDKFEEKNIDSQITGQNFIQLLVYLIILKLQENIM